MNAVLAAPAPIGVSTFRMSRRTIVAAALVVFAVASSLVRAAALGNSSLQTRADPALLQVAQQWPHSDIPLIVRETQPATADAEHLVRSLGGTITHELPIIGSFSARLPAHSLSALIGSPVILRVWGDGRLHPSSLSQYDTASPDTSWQSTVSSYAVNSSAGSGVTVALLDTGVTQVPDLGNRILAMVDFTPDQDGIDRYGHGTHMAGIIAGDGTSSNGQWVGVAPRANVVSVKVAGVDGSTDVSVVIAGMQWIVSHRAQYNIRVLNLSYGTDSRQSYLVDPLDYAVEQVWASGIFVTVASGNRGPDAGTINKPSDDPFVMTVGAADTQNTPSRWDDAVASFSSRGPTQDGLAKVDLVAPGISIVSNRAPGSTIDVLHPAARVGDSYFKGTGTSQSTAIVSGAAADVIAVNGSLGPDFVKAILLRTADRRIVSASGAAAAGAGMVDVGAAVTLASREWGWAWFLPANRGLVRSTGLGSLELSRGSYHVYADINHDGVMELVTGEIDVLGNSWSGNGWSGNSWSGNSWSSNVWSAYVSWAGNSWSGNSWSGTSWTGNSWSGNSWSGDSWS